MIYFWIYLLCVKEYVCNLYFQILSSNLLNALIWIVIIDVFAVAVVVVVKTLSNLTDLF